MYGPLLFVAPSNQAACGQQTREGRTGIAVPRQLQPRSLPTACVELDIWWSHLWQADEHITDRISAHAARVRCLTRLDRHTGYRHTGSFVSGLQHRDTVS